MPAPYGLQIVEDCTACPYRQQRFFCQLPQSAIMELNHIVSEALYPAGATLFVEGQPVRGVFILCVGRAKLSTSSKDGRTLLLRVSGAGEVLGGPSVLTGKPYEYTAEIIEPSQANFIRSDDFLSFLRSQGEAALRIAQQLAHASSAEISDMRTLGLSRKASEKLARFLLECSPHGPESSGPAKFTMVLTHNNIAQKIGSSRETVTRLLTRFKKRNLIKIAGSTVIVNDRKGLERFISK